MKQAVKSLSYQFLSFLIPDIFKEKGSSLINFLMYLVTVLFNHFFFLTFSAVHDLCILLCGYLPGVPGQWHIQYY